MLATTRISISGLSCRFDMPAYWDYVFGCGKRTIRRPATTEWVRGTLGKRFARHFWGEAYSAAREENAFEPADVDGLGYADETFRCECK